MKKYLWFILLLSGCIKKADIKLPKNENKLVVTCFITPEDSIVSAVVRLSEPRLGTNGNNSKATDLVENATVIISDGNKQTIIPFNKEFGFYKIAAETFPIKGGNFYHLKVYTPDGKVVRAETKVPENNPKIGSIKNSITTNEVSKLEVVSEVAVDNTDGKTNYLSLFYHQTCEPENEEDPFTTFSYFDTDENIKKSHYYHSAVTTIINKAGIKAATIDLTVLNCSKEFYLYNKSAQEAGIASLNPFGDPVMVYSNITGGFGCFGSYRAEKRSFILR